MEKHKDNIEKLILNNLEGINNSEPHKGHFERFEAKLAKQAKPKRTLRIVFRVAAAAVFAFLVVNQAVIYLSPKPEPITSLSSISTEYSEVEFYYTNAINTGITKWEQMEQAGLLTEEDQMLMQDELHEFEMLYKKLQEDLNANPHDERVFNAMLEYYQSKLNVINLIIDKLHEVKTIKSIENETKI